MKPKISTSYRPHGKWGDFLACIIPLVWCINILTNSNLILRLIEWQNESSLFTIRVRARQWYWIYKFELKNFTDILSTPKNIGNNRWHINTFGELQTTDNYLHILQLRSQNKWIKNYWDKSLQETGKTNKNHVISPQEQLRLSLVNQHNYLSNNDMVVKNSPKLHINIDALIDIFSFDSAIKRDFKLFDNSFYSKTMFSRRSWRTNDLRDIGYIMFYSNNNILSSHLFDNNLFFSDKKTLNNDLLNFYKNNLNTLGYKTRGVYTKVLKHEDFDEYSRWVKRGQGVILPFRVLKFPLGLETTNNDFFIDGETELFRFRFNNNSPKMQHKIIQDSIYLTLKQKRYNRKKIVQDQIKYQKDENGDRIIDKPRYKGKPFLSENKLLGQSTNNPTTQYKLIKKNKLRGELIPVTLARRLLRTKKTLVLPAHVNITIITNSYDIVHSWFLPGLGIKLDCVPGRSTHHTFYVDNVGFYYGQCAEICGRYHHHMPIRICALPFEHFLLWWNVFGLPKMLNTISRKKFETHYSMRKYSW